MQRKEVLLSSRVKAASYHSALWHRTNAKRCKGPEVMGKLFHRRRFLSHRRRALLPPRRMPPLWQQSISSTGAPDKKEPSARGLSCGLMCLLDGPWQAHTWANIAVNGYQKQRSIALVHFCAVTPEKISCPMCAATSCSAASVSMALSRALASPSMKIIHFFLSFSLATSFFLLIKISWHTSNQKHYKIKLELLLSQCKTQGTCLDLD